MQHLIEDVLEYSVLKNRKLEMGEVNMNKVIEQIIAQDNSGNHEVTFSELPIIQSNFTVIKQLFQNLIENGFKYNDSLSQKVRIEYSERDEELYFEIKDNGVGIDEVHFERIFEMFQRLHSNIKCKGTGIGLAICKRIIDQIGGKIWVTSTIGEGSIFHVIFPKSMLSKSE